MNKVYKLLQSKSYYFTKEIVNAINYNCNYYEFLVLVYLINDDNKKFNPEEISKEFNLKLEDVMNAFNNLIIHELVKIETYKDKDGKNTEILSFDNLYKIIDISLDEESKEKEKLTIFDMIEKEFGRELSPIELEIINGWLDMGNSEDIIKEALKEATYNGVKNLRYIDKILCEWGKKGFKSVEDINKHLKSKDEEEVKELFEYDWINDDE